MRVIAYVLAVRGRLVAALAGTLAAAVPALASAQEGLRELETPGDTTTAVTLVVLGIAGLFLLASIAYLYRRQRRLRWDYQLPEGWLSEGQGVDAAAHDEDGEDGAAH
jgi:hypothetical protein